MLRIVGGALSGRRIPTPAGKGTRPTAERVREGLASALEARDRLREAQILELFAGTGALSFEALSRGASRALLVDRERRLVAAIRESAASLGLESRARGVALDLLASPALVASKIAALLDEPADLVFADPPYAQIAALPPLLEALAAGGALSADALLVIEHGGKIPLESLGALERIHEYRYGDTRVVLAEISARL
ncbi:MAG: 16S rRNA (guanine(966)-N(2))-methyltransferase RsmD [Myxococcales bacterium]|nr:16S rRNA (guanine(966)-N(2))-methyltransferase RsmD [Myxococcales bacterium]